MKDSFSRLHPMVLIIYFLVQSIFTAVCFHPFFIAISFLGAIVFSFVAIGERQTIYWIGIAALQMLCFGCVNPIINHQGETVLFLLFNRAVTLESISYGILTGTMVSSMCLWIYIMGKTIDSKKAAFVFGKAMPSLSLMMFVTLRMVRRYQVKTREIFEARRGLFGEERKIAIVKKGALSLLTFGLENGVDTADAMEARGFGCAKPTAYYEYSITIKDVLSLIIILLLGAVVIIGIFNGSCRMYFFPKFFVENKSPFVLLCYGLYSFYPVIIYIWSEIKWKLIK